MQFSRLGSRAIAALCAVGATIFIPHYTQYRYVHILNTAFVVKFPFDTNNFAECMGYDDVLIERLFLGEQVPLHKFSHMVGVLTETVIKYS